MRYYRYGNHSKKMDLETKEKSILEKKGRYGELIIDEDTIYEIDEECVRCHKKDGRKSQKTP